MTSVDVREHIHRELSRGGALEAYMGELVSAMQSAVAPEWDWSPFRAIDFDETETLRASWLLPAFAAAERSTTSKVLRVDYESMDLYVAFTPTLEPPGVVARRASLARSRTVAALVAGCRMPDETAPPDGRPPVIEVWPLLIGYAAKVAAMLLESTAEQLPFEPELEVAVAHLRLGRVDRSGFVPTPPALAAEAIRAARANEVRWLAEREGPSLGDYVPYGGPTTPSHRRLLRAPDGRSWEARLDGDTIHLAFTDTDGDAHVRKRASRDPWWDVERLAAEQRREGFVEVRV